MNPKYLILDESTAMLDPLGRKEVMDTLKRLNESGMTIVLITHYMEEAAQAQRVIVLEEGKLLMDGGPREIFKEVEKMKSLRLGAPQASELAYYLKKGGLDLNKSVLTPEEFVEAFLDTLKEQQ